MSLTDRAIAQIRELIRTGALPPGSKLPPEQEPAAQLLISFVPSRETPDLDLVHDPFPLVDVPVALRLAAAPRSVRLRPGGQELAREHDGAYVHVRVTTMDGHAMVVVEHD